MHDNVEPKALGSSSVEEDGGVLAAPSWQMEQAQEEERERLAREIHDGPTQALANAIFQLEFCERLLDSDPVRLREELARMKHDLRQSLAEVRHCIFALRPTALGELGLAAALRRYAQEYEARCGITVKLEMDEPAGLCGAPEVAIFRIVQEALQNVRKHSGATEVVLRLRLDARQLEITIADNGQGFDPGRHAERRIGHFGLQGMHERARLVGGSLQIASRPGQGTKVTLTVPRAGPARS